MKRVLDVIVGHGVPAQPQRRFKNGAVRREEKKIPSVSQSDKAILTYATNDKGDIWHVRYGTVESDRLIKLRFPLSHLSP